MADLKAAALNVRRFADQHEAMLAMLPPEAPPFIETFARCSASLARVAALTLEHSIQLHLKTHEAIGAPKSPPRPKLRIIETS